MSKTEKVHLSHGITNFDSSKIKFLSNKDNENNSLEDLIFDWIDQKGKQIYKTNFNQDQNKNDNLIEKFNYRSEEEKEHRLNLIKNLHLDDKIKDDLLKGYIQENRIFKDSKLDILEKEKISILKKIKILTYISVFYSFYVFANVYDQRLNKFNNIQDMINNKPRAYEVKYKNHIFGYVLLICGLSFLLKKQKRIDDTYKIYIKNNYITLTDEDLKKYKVHMKL